MLEAMLCSLVPVEVVLLIPGSEVVVSTLELRVWFAFWTFSRLISMSRPGAVSWQLALFMGHGHLME